MKNFCSFVVLFLNFAMLTGCSQLFYYPDSNLYTSQKKLAPYLSEKELKGPYGKVIAWTFTNPDKKIQKKAHLLFYHGNAQNVSSHFYSLYWILEHGYSFTIFDYPGYGGSEGEPTPRSTTDTGKFMIDYITQTYPQSPLLIFGQSLGGNIALYTAAEKNNSKNICGVVIDSTFLSYRTVARRTMAANWLTWLLQPLAYVAVSDSYAAKKNISQLRQPLQIYHGTSDTTVAIENGQDVFSAANEPKTFTSVHEGLHTDAFTGPDRLRYQKKLLDFIKANCD